jgi:hypothetical protein
MNMVRDSLCHWSSSHIKVQPISHSRLLLTGFYTNY